MKVCTNCGINKDKEEYRIRKDSNKPSSMCKICESERASRYNKAHYNKETERVKKVKARAKRPEHHRKLREEAHRRAKERNPCYQMLSGARSRAKKKGIPFNISNRDIQLPDVCPVLKIPLLPSTGSLTDNSPTLDRRMPSLGYVKGNVSIISNLANRIKTNATSEQIAAVLEYVKSIEREPRRNARRNVQVAMRLNGTRSSTKDITDVRYVLRSTKMLIT